MRIVHISCWDTRGGAAIASSRLHLALLAQGHDSHLLCARVQDKLPNTHLISKGLHFQKYLLLNAVTRRIAKKQNDPTSFGCSLNYFSNEIIKRLNEIKPDVVHLHWVCASTLPIRLLSKIRFPILWTLHDMWPFCGAEHYDVGGLRRWVSGYNVENRPKIASGPDFNRMVWASKMRHWKNLTIHFVGVSTWIAECCRESALFKNLSDSSTVRVIHNGLDLNIFKPQPKEMARAKLGISPNAKLLLFGANRTTSRVKGGDLLGQALKTIEQSPIPIELCVFGSGSSVIDTKIPVHNLGSIKDPQLMASVYSAGDAMIVPSRIESFGQTASEALACGTPVVCFDTSGLRDIVRDKVCGIRVAPFNVKELANGILSMLSMLPETTLVAERSKIFDSVKIAKAYSETYESICETKISSN